MVYRPGNRGPHDGLGEGWSPLSLDTGRFGTQTWTANLVVGKPGLRCLAAVATLPAMMSRPQRIEYEILDCAMNGPRGADGYATTLAAFLRRLRELFPSIEDLEFTDACLRLVEQDALLLRKFDKDLGGHRDYQGAGDDLTFFYADPQMGFQLHARPLSQQCFKELSAFIDMPAGFKRRRGPAGSNF